MRSDDGDRHKPWVILCGGSLSHGEEASQRVRAGALLCCADAGLEHARVLGLRADLAVGDFDSVAAGTLCDAREKGVALERHPVAKNESDGELALRRAHDDGATEVHLFAAAGSRLDQTWATALLLPAFEAAGLPVFGYAPGWRYRALSPSAERAARWQPRVQPGTTVSLLPVDRQCAGVSISGVAFPLHDAVLARAHTLGTSNQAKAEQITISVAQGALLVLLADDPSPASPPS